MEPVPLAFDNVAQNTEKTLFFHTIGEGVLRLCYALVCIIYYDKKCHFSTGEVCILWTAISYL